ncbi:MarR family transcriptional regulator [Magnetospirillum sp. 15-1]|uniref:MarR family winged helix-turn-helix transcriptional regulator n=1 Tax=Magnetospirillum sp. 15-1 TaxID=1979370 RepID=UPI000BBB9BAC|nr:MarR family transcriptional regulator [Magnetospirillum sp. 15-1]
MNITDLIGYHLRRAEAVTKSDYAKVTFDLNISPAQFSALVVIAKNPGLMQSDLADALGIDRSAVVHLIDALEAQHLVIREKIKTNRRKYLLYITDEGIKIRNDIKRRLDDSNEIRLKNLTLDEREQLMHLLKMIYSNSNSTDPKQHRS